MKTLIKYSADMLKPGMVFEMLENTWNIIYSEPNDFGMMVVRFVASESANKKEHVLIVPNDMQFPTVVLHAV